MPTRHTMPPELLGWLLESDEPWTRYRTRIDLLEQPPDNAQVQAARREMLAHPQVKALVTRAGAWGEQPITRHNDASHPLYALSTLADFGVRAEDRGLKSVVKKVLAHRSPEGAFQTLVNISPAFGGTGQDQWTWVLCDAPTLLYALLEMGLNDERVERALAHLAGLVQDNGWRCAAAPELGRFHGPGRRQDPCPIANVYALKALARSPAWRESCAAHLGAETLLRHWENRGQVKHYLFGVGSDYHKLKYPFVWYDILHVTDVLSRLPFVRRDPRFQEMLRALTSQAGAEGRCTAGSMYTSWKGWSFADKKAPSPWLTLLVERVRKRADEA